MHLLTQTPVNPTWLEQWGVFATITMIVVSTAAWIARTITKALGSAIKELVPPAKEAIGAHTDLVQSLQGSTEKMSDSQVRMEEEVIKSNQRLEESHRRMEGMLERAMSKVPPDS